MVCTSDSGMKLYEIEEYSDHEYITGYHAWNVTYFIDVIYGADMHYYISMKRGFIMTPEIATVILLLTEVLIALYVHDAFVRPYIGDVLVVIVIYTFIRIFVPEV